MAYRSFSGEETQIMIVFPGISVRRACSPKFFFIYQCNLSCLFSLIETALLSARQKHHLNKDYALTWSSFYADVILNCRKNRFFHFRYVQYLLTCFSGMMQNAHINKRSYRLIFFIQYKLHLMAGLHACDATCLLTLLLSFRFANDYSFNFDCFKILFLVCLQFFCVTSFAFIFQVQTEFHSLFFS